MAPGLSLLWLFYSLSKHIQPLQALRHQPSSPLIPVMNSVILSKPVLREHVPFENEMQKGQKRKIPVKDTYVLFRQCYFWPSPEGGGVIDVFSYQ